MSLPRIGKGSIEYLSAASRCVAVTPHATNALPDGATRALFCSVAGNAVLRFLDDSADVTLPLLAGVVYPFCASHVRTGGTATVFALY